MRYSIILLLLSLIQPLKGKATGELSYRKVDNKEMIRVLNGFTVFSETITDDVSVRVLCVFDENNTEGGGSCDKTTSLYVAVSTHDLCPSQQVYKISSLFGPKFVRWTKDDPKRPLLMMEYGPYNKRKTMSVRVSLQGLGISSRE